MPSKHHSPEGSVFTWMSTEKDHHPPSHVPWSRLSRFFWGDGKKYHLNNRNPYFMGPYKPLRNWVDDFPSPIIWKCHGSLDSTPTSHDNKNLLLTRPTDFLHFSFQFGQHPFLKSSGHENVPNRNFLPLRPAVRKFFTKLPGKPSWYQALLTANCLLIFFSGISS